MAITLNHTIVPALDKVAAARFFADLFGLPFHGVAGPFAPVQVNDSLTLDFDDADTFEPHHLAFLVRDDEFGAIFARLQAASVLYGSDPESGYKRRINRNYGGRSVYFPDPNGHSYELLTRPEPR
jgi:catechol 2,3-dioxygenase-like lactoylglutathione lyase family enzyme